MAGNRKPGRNRPFVSVLFECCHVYQRIYLNASGKAFVGWCPKCCGKIEVRVDPSGSKSRFFTAS